VAQHRSKRAAAAPRRKPSPRKRSVSSKKRISDAAPPPSEFEAWQAQLTARERHVAEVVELMTRGAWIAGASHQAAAKRWQVTPGTVEHVAAEASRQIKLLVRLDPEGRAEVLAQGLITFQVIRDRALRARSVAGLRVGLEANERYLRYYGLEPPKNVRVSEADRDGLDGLTEAELAEVAEGGVEALQRIRQKRAEQSGSGGTG
jgi:hypothetical protein